MSRDDSKDSYSELSLSELSGAMSIDSLREQAEEERPARPRPPPPLPGGQIVEVDEDFESLFIDAEDAEQGAQSGATQVEAAATQIDVAATYIDAPLNEEEARISVGRPDTGMQDAFGERRRRRNRNDRGQKLAKRSVANVPSGTTPETATEPAGQGSDDFAAASLGTAPSEAAPEEDAPARQQPNLTDRRGQAERGNEAVGSAQKDRRPPAQMRLATNPEMQVPSTGGGPVSWLIDPDNRLILIVLLGAVVITMGVILAIALTGGDERTAGEHENRQQQGPDQADDLPPISTFVKAATTGTGAGIYTPTPGVVRYTVIGIPTDASVYLGDELYCQKTPCAVGVDHTLESAILTVSREGYIDGMVEVTPTSDTGKIPLRVVLEPEPTKKK